MGLARRLGMCPSIQSLLILEALLVAISVCFSLLYGLKNLAFIQIIDTFANLAKCVCGDLGPLFGADSSHLVGALCGGSYVHVYSCDIYNVGIMQS